MKVLMLGSTVLAVALSVVWLYGLWWQVLSRIESAEQRITGLETVRWGDSLHSEPIDSDTYRREYADFR